MRPLIPILALLPSLLGALDVDIVACGAIPDGTTVNTAAIQRAVDQVAAAGGGAVLVPRGDFVTGTIQLKSHVELRLAGGSQLLGSTRLTDYPRTNPGSGEIRVDQMGPTGEVLTASEFIQALIVASDAEDVAITGQGAIDGRGRPESFPVRLPGHTATAPKLGSRPMLMRFHHCQDLRLTGITTRNPASWGIHLVDCDRVRLSDLTIRHRSNENNDGIDIDGCRTVFISGCDISSGDDAICPKSSFGKPTENLTVRSCVVSSDTAAFKMGTSSRAGFRNVVVSDCIFQDVKMGAIKLLCVDGGTIEHVLIQNIVMDRVENPLFIRLGDRGATYQTPTADGGPVPVGTIRDITISNIRATVTTRDKARSGIMITGIPGHPVRGVRLDNLVVRYPGFGAADPAAPPVPELEKRYPEQFFFGVLPSYGIFVRHAEDLRLSRLDFAYDGAEQRPAVVLDDVADSTLQEARLPAEGPCVIDAHAVRGITVAGNHFPGTMACLVRTDAGGNAEVSLIGNRAAPAAVPFTVRP